MLLLQSHVIAPVRRLLRRAARMSWRTTLVLTLAHALTTALGFVVIGEGALVSSVTQFVYYYIVTGSSVGYGDFSPVTSGGKLFSALWVIPGAISIFAFVVGKIIGDVTTRIRRTMNGQGDFSDKTGHLVVIGWAAGQTEKLMEESDRLHGTREVVIVSTKDISALRDGWEWIRASSLANAADLTRAGVAQADAVVVLADSDDETLTACLAICAFDTRSHVVAFFRDAASADLVETHCPAIETVTSNTVEQVARALVDPGASDLVRRLVSTRVGATLQSTRIAAPDRITVGEAMPRLLERHGATLIGHLGRDGHEPSMALRPETEIVAGETIFYIATDRLAGEIDLS